MAATARQEHELICKYEKQLRNPDLPPIEKLRAYALSKGVRGLKSLSRDVTMAATARQEHELICKYEKQLRNPDLPIIERLRAYTLSKGVRGLKSLSRIFKRIDKNGDHKLDFHEFKEGLHVSGIFVPESMERDCFEEMDIDGTGHVNFDEFIVALRPPLNNRRKNLIQMAFNKLDRVQDGQITANDLKGVYIATKHPKYISGEWTEEDVFKEWLNSFNGPDKFDGIVTPEDFENYYVGVSASIDSDAYFDLMMRQAWKL